MSPVVQLIFLFGALSIVASQDTTVPVNGSLLLEIINWGDKLKGFCNIPILAGRRTLTEVNDFIMDLQTKFQRPTYILSRKIENFSFRYHIHSESLILVFFRGIDDMVLEMSDSFACGRRRMSVLFVLTKPPIAHYEIYEIVSHIWAAKYMRASLIYRNALGKDYLITFSPYSEFKTTRLAASLYRTSEIFAQRTKDSLSGYKIKSPVKFDVPRVFKIKDYNGRTQIKGYGCQLFMAFVKYRNATFEEYTSPVNTSTSSDRKDIFNLISAGEIETSLHPQVMQFFPNVESSYPVGINDVCLMIPMDNEISSYMYLWRPLQRDVWLMLVFGTFYMAFILMWIHPNSGHTQCNDFSLSILRCIGYMLNMSTCEHHSNVTWRYFFVNKSVWILGFLISTWYCALLKSFLTSTVFGSQIDAAEELIASGLRILVTHFDVEDGVRWTQLSKQVKELFLVTDADSLVQHRNELNTTYAYGVALDRWDFLNLQQVHLKRPIFRLSNICFFKHYLAYPLREDSRLKYSLNSFILNAHQSGLIEHWERMDFRYAVHGGYVKVMADSHALRPMNGDKLRLAWEILAVGLAVSAAVFMAEVSVSAYRFLRIRQCR